MTTGERLKAARGDEPRKNVCDAAGISLSTLAMYENDMRTPRDEIKVKLAQHYNLTVGELFYSE